MHEGALLKAASAHMSSERENDTFPVIKAESQFRDGACMGHRHPESQDVVTCNVIYQVT